ncbi:site-specific integrase [Herbaspirillum robiniae]|uniref:site-specific integrase n=1 Tax=Herbaspirillum robiniae TaxID=2014887 RepID=UPI00101AD360|nr:site-specific integrase [Herbaspirillum robiniae]
MIEGSWSRTGKGLSPKTANLRTQHACDFLTWLSQKGNRTEFSVPYTEKTISRTTVTNDEVKFSKTVRIRGGQAADAFPKPLILPEHEEVEHWLKEVYQKDGTTFGLICETILCTAMRREEVASLRMDTLPLRRDEWKIVNPKEPDDLQQVRIAIRYGTKGRWSGQDHGDKIGPERHILMPLRLALLWDQYRNDTRNRSINALISHMPDARLRANAVKATVHLFLRERDGKRFDGAEIYRRWNKIRIGKKNWTPHLGRHWWACSVLWNSLVTHPAISDIKKAKDNHLREHGQTIIKLIIQPQLGHRSESTTYIYLQWLMTKLSRPIVFARR